jgi:hypothetical protein
MRNLRSPPFQLVQHLLLQLLAVADDQLPVDVHNHDPVLLVRLEAHGSSFESTDD